MDVYIGATVRAPKGWIWGRRVIPFPQQGSGFRGGAPATRRFVTFRAYRQHIVAYEIEFSGSDDGFYFPWGTMAEFSAIGSASAEAGCSGYDQQQPEMPGLRRWKGACAAEGQRRYVAADRRRRQRKVRLIEFGDFSSETGRRESRESNSITCGSRCICRRCHCGVCAAWPILGDVFKLNRSLMLNFLNFSIVRL